MSPTPPSEEAARSQIQADFIAISISVFFFFFCPFFPQGPHFRYYYFWVSLLFSSRFLDKRNSAWFPLVFSRCASLPVWWYKNKIPGGLRAKGPLVFYPYHFYPSGHVDQNSSWAAEGVSTGFCNCFCARLGHWQVTP